MQVLLTVAIVGIALTALGIGFLGVPLNLMVQKLIVGEETLDAPITKALLDLRIENIVGSNEFGRNFKNVITACIVESPQRIDRGSTIFCKLTDMNNNVVTEGKKVLQTFLPANTPTVVKIMDPGFANSLVTNINDVIIVVQGPRMTGP